MVIIDSALNSEAPVSYVATDNYHGGVLAAERFGELMGGEGPGDPAPVRRRLGEHRAAGAAASSTR